MVGIVAAVVIAGILWVAFCGYLWGWGPFAAQHNIKTARLPGNAPQYDLRGEASNPDSPLAGKTVVFLGSSVTHGSASGGVSFADYLAQQNGFTAVKEAVSGTTLVDSGRGSYLSRLKRLDTAQTVDLLVCQLSTNDATQGKPLGRIGVSMELDSFDTATVAGALETIIGYAQQTWGCPVVIYSGSWYDSADYSQMVALLPTLADKWGIGVIDMWSDTGFNAIDGESRALYMADGIHPTKAGYREWWTPYMEAALYEFLEEKT